MWYSYISSGEVLSSNSAENVRIYRLQAHMQVQRIIKVGLLRDFLVKVGLVASLLIKAEITFERAN